MYVQYAMDAIHIMHAMYGIKAGIHGDTWLTYMYHQDGIHGDGHGIYDMP